MSDFSMVMAALFAGAGLVIISYCFNRTPGLRSYKAAAQRSVVFENKARYNPEPFSNRLEPRSFLGSERWTTSYLGRN